MTRRPPSLMQRSLAVFVLLAFFLGAFLWAGKTLVQRHIERVQMDTHRMAALKTFESAIVPLQQAGDDAPSAELVRREFLACADPLKEQQRERVSERERANNACASVSQPEELACYLRSINGKLAGMAGDNHSDRERMLGQTYAVSVARWAHAIRLTQVQPDVATPTEGQIRETQDKARSRVSCHEAMAAARQLTVNDGRLLTQLGWRDLTGKTVLQAAFAPEQVVKVSDRTLAQRNPWGGIPGCVYFGDGTSGGATSVLYLSDKRATNRAACLAMRPKDAVETNLAGAAAMGATERPPALDPAWSVPQSLPVILADLDNIRVPGRELYRAYTEEPLTVAMQTSPRNGEAMVIAAPHGPNELERQKHKIDVGFNVHLTIAPASQRIVQQVSACYAGDRNACQLLGLNDDKKFSDFTKLMYEGAGVRMAAIAVIDIASGRIEALGSANSDCYRQE